MEHKLRVECEVLLKPVTAGVVGDELSELLALRTHEQTQG